MVSLADSLVSSSARTLPLWVRADLEVKRQQYLGRPYWIVKDPIGSRYFRFHEEEYAILKKFDGRHSLDTIKEEFEKEFPPQKITLEELQHFLGQLHQSGLIVAATPQQGPELLKRKKKRSRQALFQKLTNILAVKFKGFDPDVVLTFLLPYVRPLFHPAALLMAVMFCLSALLLVLVEFDTFRSKLPAFHSFFGLTNVAWLGVVLACTKLLHEFGHGLTAKYFKGECHEMGFMLLVLTPCMYVNVSDAWLLPNKWHRMAITAAGVYVELVLASLCTFIWWFSTTGLINSIALNIMFVSSVSTIIFNINPLLRFDGYYLLADYLEIPNLRQKATKILSQKCSEWFLGMEKQEDPFLPQKNQLFFALYTVAAFWYRWVIMISILFFLNHVFDKWELKILGQIIAFMAIASMFGMPLYQVIKFFWVPGRIYKVKKSRFYLSLSLLAAIIGFILFFPLPYWIISPTVIDLRPSHSRHVYIPYTAGGCQLISIDVEPAQQVKQGDKLGQLENLPLRSEIVEHRGKKAELEKQIELLDRRHLVRPDAGLQKKIVEESLKATDEILQQKLQLYRDLTLLAPIDGTVVSAAWRPYQTPVEGQFPSWYGTPLEKRNLGATFEPGAVFCSVGDPQFLEAVIVVDQSKYIFVHKGDKVELLLNEFSDKIFTGTVEEIEEQKLNAIDVQLTARAGGDVATMTQKDGTEMPLRASYRVRMPLDNPDLSIRPGMTGIAKIHVAPQTLGMRAWRFVYDTFNFKL